MRSAVQSISDCSMKVPPALWSKVSSEELIGARIASGEHARQHHRAVQVGHVARMMEVDGVVQVDALQLLQGRAQLAERRVEVDGLEAAAQLLGPGAGEGPLDLGHLATNQVDAAGRLLPVGLGVPGVEQLMGCQRGGLGTEPRPGRFNP